MIQLDKVWLFESSVMDPFFLGSKDGVSINMKDERTMSLISVDTCEYVINSVGNSTFSWSAGFGGEDMSVLSSMGKQEYSYELSFDLPLYSGRIIDEMCGRLFSVICERRNGSRFAVMGQFQSDSFNIDNEHKNRMTFSSGNTSARMYNVDSINIGQINDTIDLSQVCSNLDESNRMNFDFFPTTKIPTSFRVQKENIFSAVLAWSSGAGAKGYDIRWGLESSNLDQTLIVDGGGATSAELTNIPYATPFYARIKSIGQFNDSLYTPTITGSTVPASVVNTILNAPFS